jgi:hypothetical protein
LVRPPSNDGGLSCVLEIYQIGGRRKMAYRPYWLKVFVWLGVLAIGVAMTAFIIWLFMRLGLYLFAD